QIVGVTELTRDYDARRLVWFQVAGTAAVAGLAAVLLERPQIRWTWGFVGALAYTVAFASTLCFILQMRAQRHMSSARAALIFCFEPLFAALTAWLVLGERLAVTQWLGGALIVLGMIAADLPASRAVPPRRGADRHDRLWLPPPRRPQPRAAAVPPAARRAWTLDHDRVTRAAQGRLLPSGGGGGCEPP